MRFNFWKKSISPITDGFTHIYTDALGNKWYSIANPANIHATRALTAWTYSRDAEYGLTKEQRLIGYSKMNEALNKKDISSLAKILGVFEAAEDLYATPNILLNLATCYTFLNDEKNDSYKDFIQQKKRDIWDSDLVCKAFFLQWSVQFMQQRSQSQNVNVLEYLEQAKPVLDQIDFLLRKK